MNKGNSYITSPEETSCLPGEIQDLVEEIRLQKEQMIKNLELQVIGHRKEAIDYRKQSGIEETWREDREYYYGIDDLNRSAAGFLKPTSGSGVVERNNTQGTEGRCTAFFNITRQFCDSAAARMGDILIPASDWNFGIKPSPVAENPQSMAGEAQELTPQPQQVAPQQAALDVQKEARDKCEKAETRIKDWLVECKYRSELRKVVEDAAIVGTGVLKGPIPVLRKSLQVNRSPDGSVEIAVVEKMQPASFHIKPEHLFPAPACGDDIQRGKYILEVDEITAKSLKELKKTKGYLADRIDKVYAEGPGLKNYDGDPVDGGARTGMTSDKDIFEIWYYHGLVDAGTLDAMGCPGLTIEGKDLDTLVPAVVTMINDTAIKAHLNHLDSGQFPYDVMPWQRIDGFWAGIGVSRQGRTSQDMLNAAARAMMDNAGLSSGPMIVIKSGNIVPADGKWSLTARKIWLATETADMKGITDSFQAINIPMMQPELQAIIDLARSMMEESTGVFFIMQGQQGSAPDTLGGMELLHRNSSAVLRRQARIFDENITEPHITRYYEYLLIYGEPEEKGDLQIEAIGSSALVEREIHAMKSMSYLQASLNPAFGLDPEKAMLEVLKADRFVADKWTLDDEKKAQLAAQPPPPAPQVLVAQIRAEVETLKAEMKKQTDEMKIRVDLDRDRTYSEGVARRDMMTFEQRNAELMLKRELAILDYANKNEMSLGQVKADLAKTVMKLNVQKELSLAKAGEAIEPVAEPPGRAPDGESFTK